jgi:regulation of enolase protein 1 (concanavalin A-like superfamily)
VFSATGTAGQSPKGLPWKSRLAEEPGVWEGDVWTFSTREYLDVDDFESYTDDEGDRIYQTWIDGWENKTGSVVGHLQTPFAERKIVHSGRQSMPLSYDNAAAPFYSEAERTFAVPQDWTIHGADSLRLYFHGQPATFVERSPGNIIMSAAGTDIFGTSDEFRLVSKQLTGNGTILARVESLDNTNAWAKAGVMIRENVGVGAKHAMVVISPGNGVSFQRRVSSGDITAHTTQAGVAAPVWLKLTRTGDVFKAEHSTDGKTWTPVGSDPAASSATIPMSASVHIGLALSSHSAGVLATAQFAEVSTTGTVGGVWTTTEIGVDHPGNDPAPLYVVLQDSSGRTKMVSHSDSQATTRTGWQAWRIPLSEFAGAGVKLNSIKMLAIGIGERSNPAQGGVGMVYIDDVGFGRVFSNVVPEKPDPVPTGSYSSTILSDKPFAYYRFEDASSNDKDTAADTTGSHNGTYVGKPVLISDAPGTIGGTCLEIPSTDSSSYVTASLGTLGSALGEGVSFEFWIKTMDARVNMRVFGAFNTGSNTSVSVASNSGPTFQKTVGSTQVFMRKQGGGDYGAAFDQSVKNIYDGHWHHVVWTAEQMASPGPDPFKVYIDGVSIPLTYGAKSTSAGFADFENPFYIANAGRATPFPNATIAGQLDEFAVYSLVLTQEQIFKHYQAGTSGNTE